MADRGKIQSRVPLKIIRNVEIYIQKKSKRPNRISIGTLGKTGPPYDNDGERELLRPLRNRSSFRSAVCRSPGQTWYVACYVLRVMWYAKKLMELPSRYSGRSRVRDIINGYDKPASEFRAIGTRGTRHEYITDPKVDEVYFIGNLLPRHSYDHLNCTIHYTIGSFFPAETIPHGIGWYTFTSMCCIQEKKTIKPTRFLVDQTTFFFNRAETGFFLFIFFFFTNILSLNNRASRVRFFVHLSLYPFVYNTWIFFFFFPRQSRHSHLYRTEK